MKPHFSRLLKWPVTAPLLGTLPVRIATSAWTSAQSKKHHNGSLLSLRSSQHSRTTDVLRPSRRCQGNGIYACIFRFQFKGDRISQGAWVWSMPKNWFNESRGMRTDCRLLPHVTARSSFRSIILRTVGGDTPRTFATSATDRNRGRFGLIM